MPGHFDRTRPHETEAGTVHRAQCNSPTLGVSLFNMGNLSRHPVLREAGDEKGTKPGGAWVKKHDLF